MEGNDGKMTYGRGPRRTKNLNPNRGEGFSLSNLDRSEDSSPNEYRMKIDILSFSEILDIESFLDWVHKVEKFFTWLTSLRKVCQVHGVQVQRRSGCMVEPVASHKEVVR